MVNVVFGAFLNILCWLCGYAITYWLFNTVKDVSEKLDADLQDRFLVMIIIITSILLIIYTYMVYKFGWYEKLF